MPIYNPLPNGWICSICGTWVFNGTAHTCPWNSTVPPQAVTPSDRNAILTRIAESLERIEKLLAERKADNGPR